MATRSAFRSTVRMTSPAPAVTPPPGATGQRAGPLRARDVSNAMSTDPLSTSRALVQALRESLAREHGAAVTLIETHLSWVLLAGPWAYKLKKPVRLSFVDFGTLAARH